MVSKVLRRILFIAVPLLLAASTATAQDPNVPAGRLHHSGVYDESRKEFVIYGGYTWNPSLQKVQSASDVWGWNGSRWELICDSALHKYVAAMAFDSKRERILIFGGADDSGAIDGKLRSLEGGTWRVVKDLPTLERADASMAYDSKRDRLVLFGGRNEVCCSLADTWEFDGNDWKPTFMAGPSALRGSRWV